jgi:GGDEF domain-containing protein
VLKSIVGKIFGFNGEIQELKEQIEHLRWDTAFGMWTREAFLQFCQIMPRGKRILAFIDLDRIHVLNEEYGYAEVDRRVKSTFSVPFRRSDIVARWYSGDEIVILFDSERSGAESKMAELVGSASSQGLSFKFVLGNWEVGKTYIEEVVEGMSNQLAMEKEERR